VEQQMASLESHSVAPLESDALAPHETMELHELINFKTLALAKAKLLQGLVFDKDLKALMQKDVEQSTRALEALVSIYQSAPIH
jgi:similar to spore coat protein